MSNKEPTITKTGEQALLPALYSRTSKGAVQFWQIAAEGPWIVSRFGLLGMKIQETRKEAKPKSVGKANETTPKDQALSESISLWKKKVDKGYKLSAEAATSEEVILPMLAHPIDKYKKKIKYPCFVQPKLDGVRSLAYWVGDEVVFHSRKGKVYNVPHLAKQVKEFLPKDMILDGEIYIHRESFQTLSSWVKKLRDETSLLQYHVYDCILLNERKADFTARNARLRSWYLKSALCATGHDVKYVETLEASTEDDVYSLQKKWAGEGYEGAIVRNRAGVYKMKHRSSDLLKVKSFQDAEYKVIGCNPGEGKFKDFAIWTCEMSDGGDPFTVVNKGTAEERTEMLRNADNYIGRWLKVKFFAFTDSGLPRFPVGTGFRLPEDM